MKPHYYRGRTIDGPLVTEEGKVNTFCSYTLPILATLLVAIATCAVSSITLATELDTNKLVKDMSGDGDGVPESYCEMNPDFTTVDSQSTETNSYFMYVDGILHAIGGEDSANMSKCDREKYQDLVNEGKTDTLNSGGMPSMKFIKLEQTKLSKAIAQAKANIATDNKNFVLWIDKLLHKKSYYTYKFYVDDKGHAIVSKDTSGNVKISRKGYTPKAVDTADDILFFGEFIDFI